VANAQTLVNQAKLSLSDTSLRASIGGWVAARNVDTGSIVGNSTVGFTLVDTSLVKAVFAVPDSSLASIRLGQKQVVALDTVPHPVQGVVTSIAPQADPKGRVFSVEVTLENAQEQIRPGMIGALTLAGEHASTPRLVVPLGAVVRAPSDPNGFAVFRLIDRDGKTYVSSQVIQIGQTFGNSIEVTSGLATRQRIVALGGTLVHDGQEVRVLP
jgi:RND family efflux transporter MFP subunit